MSAGIPPNFLTLHEHVPESVRDLVNSTVMSALMNPDNTLLRSMVAMSCYNVPWYRDGWEGFSYERDQLYQIFKNDANNVTYAKRLAFVSSTPAFKESTYTPYEENDTDAYNVYAQ